ncbi:MAG: MBL fold metallo-hydrolase [Myxococcota bacterium]
MRLGLFVLALATTGCIGFGRVPRRAERAQLRQSPQFEQRKFRNPEPMYIKVVGVLRGAPRGIQTEPEQPLPVVSRRGEEFAQPPASGLRATWLGHSSVLLEIDGKRVLTDPHWGPRSSPFRHAGPKRWYAPPLPLEEVPAVDAVLISHDHYDHLGHDTIGRIAAWQTRFIVPLGVGGHLERWGVPTERITEVDWWDEVDLGGVRIACVPSRHASGRRMVTRDRTLWAGYALLGDEHRVYFSGDTGLFPAMETIGTTYGPFDLTMIEVGAYDDNWPDWHLGPEQAVLAHLMVRGRALLPIHWGLFRLAPHGWTEPIERVHAKAKAIGVRVATPRPGESIELATLEATTRWWPDIRWQTEDQNPIRATRKGDRDDRMDHDALFERFAPGRPDADDAPTTPHPRSSP